MTRPVLEVEALKKHFPVERGLLRRAVAQVKAVDGITFHVARGETLCLVGESGCGKSTVGRLIMRLTTPTAGRILVDGTDIATLSPTALRAHRRRVQMVFQDPYASLNPRLSAGDIVAEPLQNYEPLPKPEREARVAALFDRVGLRADSMRRYPFEFSGGQRQRLGIARALSVSPDLIVADEPVSALDVSVQAQVLNLLLELQESLGVAYLFISHDLGVVEHIAHRVAVMYLGRIVEVSETEALFAAPKHPYTEALLAAAPIPDPKRRGRKAVLEGDVPSPVNPPPGCAFHTRCPIAEAVCRSETPALRDVGAGRALACHLRS
jgi:oligopeptide/dipeptide ABC transporter ATP-binding protein